MKILLLGIALSTTIPALSQQTDCKPERRSQWFDTSHSYSSTYGRVATLTGDHMPCIIPYPNGKGIPNPAKGQPFPSRIPNAWSGMRPKQTPSVTEPMRSAPGPLQYRSTP